MGNQQKVLLARWLRLRADRSHGGQPDRGNRSAFKAWPIHSIIRDAALGGTTFLICSSDTEELVEVCDRIIVMFGKIVAERAGEDLDRDEIDTLCLHRKPERKPAERGVLEGISLRIAE